jgi:hypothetical protein
MRGKKMEVVEKILEMRGMRRREIVAYFVEIAEIDMGEGKFRGKGWEVQVGDEDIAFLGSLKIPATRVRFVCDIQTMEKALAAFRLKFLSAGG